LAVAADFSLDRTLGLVHRLIRSCRRWNEAAGVEEPRAEIVVQRVLARAADLVSCVAAPDRAADLVFSTWRAIATGSPEPSLALPIPHAGDRRTGEQVAIYLTAVAEALLDGEAQRSARQALRGLRLFLDLGYDDVGRMLRTSGETVRRWERGAVRVPDDARARISAAHDLLGRLTRFFNPSRLPEVVRRPARTFDGQRALDWIVRGDLDAVVARYDAALSFQG
jgi:hypothetical protein